MQNVCQRVFREEACVDVNNYPGKLQDLDSIWWTIFFFFLMKVCSISIFREAEFFFYHLATWDEVSSLMMLTSWDD